jgi:hypothetical protein
MEDEDLRAEVARLRAQTQYLTKQLSHLGGRYDAAVSALLGMLNVMGSTEAVRQSVHMHMERRQAMDLAANVNQDAVDSFQELADLVRLAMRDAAERANKP